MCGSTIEPSVRQCVPIVPMLNINLKEQALRLTHQAEPESSGELLDETCLMCSRGTKERATCYAAS